MLTQLQTVKSRLGIAPADIQNDTLLTNAIAAVSARFDLETNRTLARTVDATYEFGGDEVHLAVPCYPIETVTRFELKFSEADLWQEQPTPDFLIRRKCVVSLSQPLCPIHSALCIARMTYTAGYVLPGSPDPQPSTPDSPSSPQLTDSQLSTFNSQPTPLPPDLEHAAIEQVAFWFQTRNAVGVIRNWPSGGNYQQYADIDILPSVRTVLRRHTRFLL